MIFVTLFFVIWRFVDLLIAYSTTALNLTNSSFSFAYSRLILNLYIPKFLILFANYDGEYYLHIAHDGYLPAEQAYFPLYPLAIHFLTSFLRIGFFYSGFLISNISFFFGLYFFKKYLELLGKKPSTVLWVFLFLICFPTSFFFGAVYTEGLFFLLVTATLYLAQKKHYARLMIVGILAALTRLMGVFLVIPIIAILLADVQKLPVKQKTWRGKSHEFFQFIISNKKLIFISLAPLLGLFSYMTYLFATTGDYLAFYHLQAGFNNGRSTSHLIFLPQVYYRYIHIFLTASLSMTYFVAVIEFLIFTLFFVVLLYDLWKIWNEKLSPHKINMLGLNLFSLVNLILPTLTGTLTSTPRYLLFSLSFFIRIAEVKSSIVRVLLLILFALFHIILLSLFIQGYFIG